MDYGKYKYEQTKKLKEAKKHQATVSLKEIKFRPATDQHDLDFKVRNIQKFVDEGHKVKATVRFRGREMAHRERGRALLDRVFKKLNEAEEIVQIEVFPKMEGRQMMMILTPSKSKPA